MLFVFIYLFVWAWLYNSSHIPLLFPLCLCFFDCVSPSLVSFVRVLLLLLLLLLLLFSSFFLLPVISIFKSNQHFAFFATIVFELIRQLKKDLAFFISLPLSFVLQRNKKFKKKPFCKNIFHFAFGLFGFMRAMDASFLCLRQWFLHQ